MNSFHEAVLQVFEEAKEVFFIIIVVVLVFCCYFIFLVCIWLSGTFSSRLPAPTLQ